MKIESSAATWHGVVFVFLIAQQIIAFVFGSYSFVSIYWICVTLFSIFLFYKLHVKINRENVKPFVLLILCSSGALVNSIIGNSLGTGLCICYYSFLAFLGLNYIKRYRINTVVFLLLFILMYVFYYFNYFIFDEVTRRSIDGELFINASSNTIPISLNMVLIIYWIVSQGQLENHRLLYLLISLLNLGLIIIQGSRAGILVAFVLALFSILNFFSVSLRKILRFRFIAPLVVIIIIISYYNYNNDLSSFLEENQMEGVSSYEDDVRYFSQLAFFSKMDLYSFLFGYPKDFEFVPGITRTFNAFLDLWSRCGLASLIFVLYCLVYRLKNNERYIVPVLLLIPFFLYAPFESLWGGTLWDICLFVCLFYSHSEQTSVDS